MITAQDIEKMDKDYLAEDGGMCLIPKPAGERDPFHGQPKRTALCDNATLFRAEYELSIVEKGFWRDGEESRIFDYLTRLESNHPGLFHRNPGRNRDTNSFDEYLGICALATLFQLPQVAQRICDHGERSGWQFNNFEPFKFDTRYWRQGIDVFTYKMCTQRTAPTIYEFIWFILGTLWGFFCTSRSNTSDPLLNWTRLHTLSLLELRPLPTASKVYLSGVLIMRSLMGIVYRIKWGGMKKITETYFGPDHPIAIIHRW